MKGILFNTVNVKAILDDRKFETRRPIKPQPTRPYYCGIGHRWDDGHGYEIKPICLVGDILYARETWNCIRTGNGLKVPFKTEYWHKANNDFEDCADEKWRPSIHMPKTAARIFLEVTAVRVERLQDITVEEICNEGVNTDCFECIKNNGDCNSPRAADDECGQEEDTYMQFEKLWNSTIKKQDLNKYSWQANPYVFCYEFKRINKPEGPNG